ncbi:hypothetical protein PR001_g19508 [Phytophthora rubi]|uniref:ZSWIM1/3 RNaseH-like domain-containing protein n=1 Tax=Phytophthora rubi TaxID=129364 RepID=A0A6A3JQX7_9STRA|nr:hypothetical protein PR001_g19508 [Phytophthora rubi]
MNTIVPDADGAFFGEFSKRWRSWEFFHEQFDLFTANSYQRFSVRSTTSVEKRNKQILNSKKFRGGRLPPLPGNEHEDGISDGEVGSKIEASISVEETAASDQPYAQFLIPSSWAVYCKTLKCTHAIKQQKRGDGRRSHRVVRYTGCTAQVNATLQKQKGGKYYIFLKAKGSHNHALSPELWEYYAENRRIQDPLVLQAVGDMRQSGSSAKGILAYLRKRTGKKTALRDVHNMLQAIRSERRGDTTDATRTEYVLREFVSQEKGNSATIFVDSDTQQAHVVVFQSARMKRLFQAFPEVVLVDTTHGTNANQYKLFSFAVTDFFERGQYVQHALVLAETKDNLRLAIECFQRCNPAWAKIRVFVTDKAFHEKDVLFENFPQTRQLLCTFHVIAWLERQAGRLSTGTADHKDKLKATLTSLVTAKSETEYMSKEKRICCSYYMETKITSSIARSSITGTAAELNGCCTNEVMFPTWETTPITV